MPDIWKSTLPSTGKNWTLVPGLDLIVDVPLAAPDFLNWISLQALVVTKLFKISLEFAEVLPGLGFSSVML